MEIDFGLTAKDYIKYRAGYPDRLFRCLLDYGVGLKDQLILDIGTGTGYLARNFAKKGALVTGVDISSELMEEAKKLDEKCNANVKNLNARAENLPFSSSMLLLLVNVGIGSKVKK